MIRFSCSKCGREYLLSNALAHLPLLCKGCGDRIIVPDPSESPPEPPPVPPPDDDKPEYLVTPTVEDSAVNLFLSAEARKNVFMPIEGSGLAPPPHPMPPVSPPPAPIPTPIPVKQPMSNCSAKFVDAAVLFVVLCLGAFVGELVARKSTLQILGDAPASPKFPPTDLVVWIGAVAVFGLTYIWLVTRGWSIGARLKRR